jgi:hypothetical protein
MLSNLDSTYKIEAFIIRAVFRLQETALDDGIFEVEL